jgi:hypothetical protein
MRDYKCGFLSAAMLLTALFVAVLPTHVYSQANFYEGKTVTLIAFNAPGGSGDLRVKAILPFLKKHIPGNPTVVIEYMDGGGGRKGANYLYHSVRPDGLTIGAASGAIVGLGIMREQGVTYDVDRFIYLGTPEHENHAVIYTRKDLGLDNLEKLKTKPGIRIGGQTVGHVSYVAGRFFAYFLDFKEPKFVVGYTSPEVDIALMNGEVDARANAAISVLRRNPEWLDKGLMDFHAIMEVPKGDKHPRLSHLPEVESFAKTEREKKVLAVWRAFRGVGSPYILPPRTPKDRVEILEEAMRRTFKDPEFPKYFRKLVDDDPSPLGAADLTKVIREMPRDAEILELLKRFSGAGPLPAR